MSILLIEWQKRLPCVPGNKQRPYPKDAMAYVPTLTPETHPNLGKYGSPMECLGIELIQDLKYSFINTDSSIS